jgi:hypothetical protein
MANSDILADLANRFTYHKPFGSQPVRYEVIRDHARGLATMLVELCPPSRELSLALTKLEESIFWANASIARNEKEEATPACDQDKEKPDA